MQPLNEAYKNEILEAYQKISDTFDDFTQLMRKRVPYDNWPNHMKIAGVSEEMMGKYLKCDPPGTKFDAFSHLKRIEPVPIPEYEAPKPELSVAILSKIQDMGRIEEKLLTLLDDDIFETTSKHNPYWHSENEEIGDKLDDLRRKFSCLHDNLWDIIAILRKDTEF